MSTQSNPEREDEPAPQDPAPEAPVESVAGEEDPGASLDTVDDEAPQTGAAGDGQRSRQPAGR